ncbi:MFS transporter [Vreelandella titanicae]|uniref:Major facilitator superfamily, general substrate transporter n=1 Tax=Vreelandella titanicae BH1 TaxID=1204738 RepID=L9U9G9_9GAMM|nr:MULTISPECIES: MFS transporter [Halomonas]ELY20898.1 Major facilitator superfamily, general substrate transporter [Halomonas titanicae BH1]MCD1588104.1 MFS transporter [Halomonas sp. IOP_14]NVE91450.1 MFS transporter [Halomonas titanicae]
MELEQTPRWWAVVAVMIGIFLLVTAEQLPIGLLSQVASSMGVTPGMAGLMVTVPGVVAAFSAPLLPVAVGRLDRRIMLTALMAVMVAGSVLSALASSFILLLAARVLVGLSIGGFWAVAGSIAPRLVPEAQVPKAMTMIFGGVAAASVLGVPLGTLLGDLSNWRVAFGALGGLSLLTAAALWFWLPPLPPREPVRLRVLAQQFSNRGVRVAVLTTAFVVVGHFAAYTFISPILQEISGISQRHVSSLLLLYGAAGIVGNIAAGMFAGRHPYRAVLAIPSLLLIVVAVFPLLGVQPSSGVMLLMMWGAVFGSVSVSIQTWIIRTAPNTEAATALMAFTFNMSIGLGAMLGGRIVDGTSLPIAMWAASGLFLLGALLVWRTPSRIVGEKRR